MYSPSGVNSLSPKKDFTDRIVDTGLVSLKRLDKEKEFIYTLRKEKAQRGLQDLYFFCKYILGYKDMELQPHRDMCDFIQNGFPVKLDLEPRNSFKSSLITIGYTIQQILIDPDIRVLINSQDVKISKKFLTEIKGHFEHNEEFISIYGDWIGPKWTDSEIIVSRRKKHRKEETIQTGGIETPRTGMHVDLMINDDLLDEHNTNTPDQIEKATDFWKHQQQIPEPHTGRQITVGTRWAVGDTYDDIQLIEKQRRKAGLGKGLIVRIRGAHKKDGSLYFPERLTENFLKAKKIEIGSAIYYCQYENNPVDDSAVIFKKKWMKFYGHYPPKGLITTIVMDPAVSTKDDACDTAFTAIGVDSDGYWYILSADFLKDEPDKVVDRIFFLNDIHNPNLFGIETVAFQKTYKFWVWERMRQTGRNVNIVELKTDTSVTKDMRIKGLVPYFESGSILWPGNSTKDFDENMTRLWDQVTMYPMSKFIDGLDSLAYHLQLYTPPAERKKEYVRPAGITINDLMGERRKRIANQKNGAIPSLGEHSFAPIQTSFYEKVS